MPFDITNGKSIVKKQLFKTNQLGKHSAVKRKLAELSTWNVIPKPSYYKYNSINIDFICSLVIKSPLWELYGENGDLSRLNLYNTI
jgi:hypothetical protein